MYAIEDMILKNSKHCTTIVRIILYLGHSCLWLGPFQNSVHTTGSISHTPRIPWSPLYRTPQDQQQTNLLATREKLSTSYFSVKTEIWDENPLYVFFHFIYVLVISTSYQIKVQTSQCNHYKNDLIKINGYLYNINQIYFFEV